MVSFKYVEFYDVPRLILFGFQGRHFLLKSLFDDNIDEYPEDYTVYALSPSDLAEFERCGWKFIESTKLRRLGQIPVRSVRFDGTKRKKLDASILARFVEDGSPV